MLKKSWHRLSNGLRQSLLATVSPQQGYDRWAASYGENMNPVQVLESEALLQLLPDLQDTRMLDLGCGKGRISHLALERGACETVGVDLSEAMLQAAAASTPSPKARWVQGSVVDLPFADHAFDVVICALTLGHVADLETALTEMARVLRPGGWLLISGFHPYATLRGWQRTFTDAQTGQTVAIEQHAHLFEGYIRCFKKLNMVVDALEEPCYDGFPLVFVMRAQKGEDSI